MSLTTKNRQVIKEVPWGVYVWECPDGNHVVDEEGNFMLVFCEEGDRKAIAALADAAKHYGFPEGKAVYWTGRRPISTEEYESQIARAKAGLIPDPLDIAAINEEAKALRIQNG